MSIDLFDPPAAALSESELTRRRTHLVSEIERPAELAARRSGRGDRRMRLLGRKTALAVVLATLIAVVAALAPARLGHDQTLIDRAIAAIGKGRMTHVVLVTVGPGPRRVDLRTGATTFLRIRREIWTDPKLGSLQHIRVNGGPTRSSFLPPSPNRFQLDPGLRILVQRGLKSLLARGHFHEIGSGRVAGQAVEWIASEGLMFDDGTGARPATEEIAISRVTYKPLMLRLRPPAGRPLWSERVLTAEALSPRPALFAHQHEHRQLLDDIPLTVTPNAPLTTLRAARAAMDPDPIVPPRRLAGLERGWVGLSRYFVGLPMNLDHRMTGVELFYGRSTPRGLPVDRRAFISITEFPRINPFIMQMGLKAFREDVALVSGSRVTMRTHGLYVIVGAGSPAQALAAARALAR